MANSNQKIAAVLAGALIQKLEISGMPAKHAVNVYKDVLAEMDRFDAEEDARGTASWLSAVKDENSR